jgi:hypothetical protein
MLAPFLSYLRVYEPVRAFEGPSGDAVRAALARGAVLPEALGNWERELCLRAALGSRLLPPPRTEILVTERGSGDVLVCPLDTRARAGAAVLGFLDAEPPFLKSAVLPVPETAARRSAEHAVAELGEGAAHIVSASWTVPLPWFALVDQEDRRVRTRPRRVWWQVPIGRARSRAARAEEVIRAGFGDGGAAEVLAETGAWLERFDRDSVVELDYGGLVHLIDDAGLRSDTSAAQVREALRALRDGDADGARRGYERLRAFWSPVAGKQRAG